jgi:hypothetical protein
MLGLLFGKFGLLKSKTTADGAEWRFVFDRRVQFHFPFFFVLLGFPLWLKKAKKSCLLHKYSADSATFPALPLQLRSVACEQWTPINNEDRDIER